MSKQQPAIVLADPEHSTQYVTAFRAPSRSHDHIRYVVRFDRLENAWSCECPGYTYRGHCGHIDAGIAAIVAEWRQGRRDKAVAA